MAAKRKSASDRRGAVPPSNKGWLLAPPGEDDLLRLLRAWRLWILGGLLGGLLGAILYAVFPPLYRAQATVNVDFHLEQAWPDNTDREQFYYLERETRKLIEIAMGDAALGRAAASVPNLTIAQLRGGAAQLSQPGHGGWHFYGIDRDSGNAAKIASTWAMAFVDEVNQQVARGESGLEPFITAELTQVPPTDPGRLVDLGTYMLGMAILAVVLAGAAVLFLHRPNT